jgi:succinoglycan biosynthesis transport protein ExoP
MISFFQPEILQAALNPRSILRALWKRKVGIGALWLLGTGAAAGVVWMMRPIYMAEATVLVESQKIPETFVAATVQTALEARLDQLKQKVLSRDRLWALVKEFNLYDKQRRSHTKEEVVAMMREDIIIALDKGWSTSRPGAFRVSYGTHDPKVAAEVTNRISRFFIDENLRERAVEAEATSAFLDSQLDESKRQLQEQEAKLRDFKEAYLGELPQQEGALLASLSQNKAELLGVQDSLARAQQNKLVLQNSLAVARENSTRQREQARRQAQMALAAAQSVPDAAVPAAAAPPAPTDLDRALAQLRALRMRYEDKHPDVQRALAEVARLEKEEQAHAAAVQADPPKIASAPGPARPVTRQMPPAALAESDDPSIKSLEGQLALQVREIETLEARHQRLIKNSAETQEHLQKLPIREQQLAAITRDYDTNKANYRSLLDKKLSADVATNMELWQKAERFVMLDKARVPEKPVKPRRVLLTGLGSLVSLLGAAVLAFGLEFRKNVVLGEWELPAGTVVAGRVPRMQMQKA